METEPKLELDGGCSEYADRYQEMKLFKEKKKMEGRWERN